MTPEEYTKHFILDFAKNEPTVAYNISLDHFLLDDDIRRILNKLGYYTAADMIEMKLIGKMLYRDADQSDVPRDADQSDVPSWITSLKYSGML